MAKFELVKEETVTKKPNVGLQKNAQRITVVRQALTGLKLENARVSTGGYLTFEGSQKDFPRLVNKLLGKGVGLTFKPEKQAFKLFKF